MNRYPETEKIQEIINSAKKIVIVQADNPDIDSLASSLALESVLGDLGKEIYLYCGVDIPSYLHYLPGWGRVIKDMPKQFDASIIVDTSSDALLEQLQKSGAKSWLATRPTIVLDHHSTEATITFASVICNHPAVATGEIVYELAGQLSWRLDTQAKDLIAMAILSDSLGLMSQSTTPRSIHIIAELVEAGVNLPELESARRETLRREPELIHYKGELLKRVEFHSDNRIAMVSIPWEEIERYSPLYNPSMLVIDDMRLGKGTDIAIAFKLYRDGKVTAKIRCNYGWGMADKLAEHFGGGGHPLASGFKVTDGRSHEQVKTETIQTATKLLSEIEQKKANETP
ncbi:MAG TPA: DHH family phosphoesterase [Candidatus Saccharimonadales bacterium]|nr:DHH family phosphoesterase [Candidatus Saccharimonadales bacterium]